MSRRACLLVGGVALCLSACGRYADFTLPPVSGGDPHSSFALDQRLDPVMHRGGFLDVLNPSVVQVPGGYVNFYSGFDGRTWHTARAESQDGFVWQDRGVILSPDPNTWEGSYIAANGTAIVIGDHFWYWYQAGPKGTPRIGLAESDASAAWHKDPAPVLDPGPYGSWDEFGVADPYVIRVGPYFYLYYLGQDRARPTRQQIGVARSRDGRHWEKLRTNPVLGLDETLRLKLDGHYVRGRRFDG